MRRPRGRGRTAMVTAGAVVCLVTGSWLVVGVATAASPVPGAAPVRGPIADGHAGTRPAVPPSSAMAGTAPGPATTVARPPGPAAPTTASPSGPGPGAGAAPPTTAPPPTSTPTPTPTTTPGPVPTAAPEAAAVPAVTAPPVPVAVPRARAVPAPLGASGSVDQVASALISTIDQRAVGKGAIPVTADTVALLARWIVNEGGLWADNPLNTSLDSGQYPHEITSGGQDTGIPIFPTLAAGLTATATTLLSNASYGRILRLLRAGRASCVSFARAVIASPWASSHYGRDVGRFCSGIAGGGGSVPRHRHRS